MTNGVDTYALFIYPYGLMQWTTHRAVDVVNVLNGIYLGDAETKKTNPFSYTPSALELNKISVTEGTISIMFNIF